ncbi:MAG: hypothetical protein A3K03_06310 [Bdellovibrionales bacterium RIFOXYD1_FULL_44_7]|nr:MAG: hypothetical protein A3K03_06310 [Bdellovibrionales bacterium RIFOXYD1_FULL_44_7]
MLKREKLLQQILSQPTAPFKEFHVASAVINKLLEANLPFFTDTLGNIIIGAKSKQEYLQLLKRYSTSSIGPLRIYMAHMDHPGFHGQKWLDRNQLKIKWFGGSPIQFLEGTKVWIADKQGYLAEGSLSRVKIAASKKGIESAVVSIPSKDTRKIEAKRLFGAFKFQDDFWKEKDVLYTKAADDLVGVFAILNTALEFAEEIRKRRVPFIGLLTRAEEVGFIGAIGHFELGWINKQSAMCISLECSRTIPGAEIGSGPVVRLGDKFSVFHSAYLHHLSEIAQKTLPSNHQRKLMDGGTCEASAATVYNIPAIGISMPLGNYHNQNFGQSLSKGPAPEYVSLRDMEGLLKLCAAVLNSKIETKDPWRNKRTLFHESLQKFKPLLSRG